MMLFSAGLQREVPCQRGIGKTKEQWKRRAEQKLDKTKTQTHNNGYRDEESKYKVQEK